MYFASDNAAPAADAVLEAMAAVNRGFQPAYGVDAVSRRIERQLADLFEREVAVFPVTTGTAANALALAQMSPPWGAVIAHEEGHIMHDECGAPEFFTNGAKLVGVAGRNGKVTPEGLSGLLARDFWTPPTHVTPSAFNLSQATEAGTVYRPEEVAALAEIARGRGLRVHMDGARFANAVVSTGATPAELTWKAGVEVLSFGFTKNGAMAAEAIVVFAPDLVAGFAERRKRGGHLWSKSRYVAAQIEALLADGLWLDLAGRANASAARLASGLEARGLKLAFPVEANEAFVHLPAAVDAALRSAGAVYYPWSSEAIGPDRAGAPGDRLARLICSFATAAEDIDALLRVVDEARVPA
jgi:threonine aldolase